MDGACSTKEENKCVQIFFRMFEGNHNSFEDLEVDPMCG